MSPLKVAVIGASGKIGKILCTQLKESEAFATPKAIVRAQEQVDYFVKEIGIEASLTSIEDASVSEIAEAIKECDAVVFTAGAGGKGSPTRILTVDLDGAVKAIGACEIAGIKRFVIVSAIKAEDREFWTNLGALRPYYIAKKAADSEVRQSSLNYTIVQPGYLVSGKGTGKLCPEKEISWKIQRPQIEREDVASFIVASLLNPEKTNKKTISLVNGSVPIKEFIANL